MKNILILSLLIIIFNSCNQEEKKNAPLLSLLSPSSTGIDFTNQLKENEQNNIIEYLYFNNGAGVAAGDINNDGLADLYFTSNQNSNKLYLNKGNFEFEDITDRAGVGGTGSWKTGVTMADVNGDSLLDIYVCQVGNYKSLSGKNQLFINQGDLTFKDEAKELGLDFQGFSTQAAFFDFDMDGDLDMYLLNHSVHTSRSYGDVSLRFDFDSLAGDRLFRNELSEGKQKFTDVTREAGIYSSQIGYGLGVNICDINNDGLPDIFVTNDFHENDYLYINNGDGTFSEHLTDYFAHTSRSSMGNDVGDFNNDGLLDVCVLDMLPEDEKIRKQSGGEDDYELFMIKRNYGYFYQFTRNTLQLNLGGGLFSEIGRMAGIFSTDWSWSPLFCDLDNDGWKDIFITTGIYRRANDLDYIKYLTGGDRVFPGKDNRNASDSILYSKMPLYQNFSYIYRNNSDLTFTNMASEWGINKKAFSNGSTYADLDNDGDPDLIVNNINDHAFIYKNNASAVSKNHFLTVALKGTGLNRNAIGTRVILYSGGHMQVSELWPTRGFLSSTSDNLHFGLGDSEIVDSLVVRWPDLSQQTIKEIRCDNIINLDIRNSTKKVSNHRPELSPKKVFSISHLPGLTYAHKEDPYVDFLREPLAPHSLTSEGPAIATGDVNGDGLTDIFCGGAKGQSSFFFIQNRNGSFSQVEIPVIANDRYADNTDAEFLDADGDGDQDLYIVRGGNEMPAGDPRLYDILLINDGKGNFTKGELPSVSHNGSCVRPCDYDGDGDMDLFVGSRSFPGAYGWPAEQYLLENDGKGHFKKITAEKAPWLKDGGMVTDATWVDYDADGDNDLIVTGEWMKVSVLRNDNGNFKDVTATAGLENTSGWWSCINAADINGDGKTDLIAGNAGLNTILKPSEKEPVEMYLSDIDNNGSLDQIICYSSKGVSYPFASFDELFSQIPGVMKKYSSYSDFAGKSVKDILGKKEFENCVIRKAVKFESCLFINNGDGTFKTVGLPAEAQFSVLRSAMAQDFNGDGKTDIVVAGNDYAVRPSYGRQDASYGWYLRGDSVQTFHAMIPAESGLIVKGDARKILPIMVKDERYLLVGMNNDSLKVFRIIKK